MKKEDLDKHLQLMHMLADVFAAYKDLPTLPSSLSHNADHSPQTPKSNSKAPRFTALRAKLDTHLKEQSEPEVSNAGVSEG